MRLDTVHSLVIVLMVALATQITRWTPFLLFSDGKSCPRWWRTWAGCCPRP